MKTFTTLLTEVTGEILVITLNREEKLNALTITLIHELDDVFTILQQSPELKGVIITGKGTKAFAAGGDISVFIGMTVEQGIALAKMGHKLFDKIEMCPKPVIAAVNGLALGGGLELAMACHLRIASKNAMFGLPEVKLGLIPGFGGTQRLTSLIKKGKALELLLTGGSIGAGEAEQIGLVSYLTENEKLLDTSKQLLIKIASMPNTSLAHIISDVCAH